MNKIIIAALALGILSLSGMALAYTGIPSDFTFTKKLNIGSNNQDVVYLKVVLANEGCLSGVTNTTYFGVKTGAAVQCFKKKYGIGSGTTLVSTSTNAKLNQIIKAVSTPTITLTSPNGGEVWKFKETHNITWTASGLNTLDIHLVNDSAGLEYVLASNFSASSGSFSWTIPTTLTPSPYYKVRLKKCGDACVFDESDSSFTISTNSSLTLLSPNGGESWSTGTTKTITWRSEGVHIESIKIDLYKGGVFLQTITSQTNNTGSYAWTIPTTLAADTNYKIKVSKYGEVAIYDESDNNFGLSAPDCSILNSTCRACVNSSDCLLINENCCPCSSGGGNICINKSYENIWRNALNCTGTDIVCLQVYLCNSLPTSCVCVNGYCSEVRKKQVPIIEQLCLLEGGTWDYFGSRPTKSCRLRTSDSGRTCTDSEQCEGECLGKQNTIPGISTTGTCSEWVPVIGCYSRIEDGIANSILCTD